MEFTFSEEQQDLKRAVRTLLERRSPPAEVLRRATEGAGYDRDLWRQAARQLGLHGLAIPEEYGGSGCGAVELGAVLEEIGRMVLDLPFFSSVVLAATAVRSIGDPRAAGRILPGIAAGDTVATLALTEETGGWDAGSVRTRAEYRRGQWLLTGTKSLVPDGMAADLLLVAARSEEGLGLFALRPDAPGVARDPLPALDPTRPLARLGLSAAPAELLGEPGAAWPALRHTLDVAAVALAAEQAGGAAAALDMAVEYAGSREQFGRPIGGFQAIKHRCADMLVDVESARALAHYGLLAADRDDGGLPLAAATAKAYCSAAYTRCAEANVQIHGGIGFTWEHPAHLHLKRAKASEAFLGSPGAHLDAVATHAGY